MIDNFTRGYRLLLRSHCNRAYLSTECQSSSRHEAQNKTGRRVGELIPHVGLTPKEIRLDLDWVPSSSADNYLARCVGAFVEDENAPKAG